MAKRTKRLYRAIAYYADGTVTRHFQTKRARALWVANRLEGYPERNGQYISLGALEDNDPAIPPAIRVEVADSEPIVFPGDDDG